MNPATDSRKLDRIFLRLFMRSPAEDLTEEEVSYFREHPNQIDEITAPVNVHKMFLWAGGLLGAAFVGLAKIIQYSQLLTVVSVGYREFVVDIVFQVGAALIGGAVTAYILGILLNQQQENAARWRAEIRRRIGMAE